MPHPWALADSNFPAFTGAESPYDQIRQVVDYLMMLNEALRYQLENLDESNWNSNALDQMKVENTGIAEGITALKQRVETMDNVMRSLIRTDDEGNIIIGQEGKSLHLLGSVYINGILTEQGE